MQTQTPNQIGVDVLLPPEIIFEISQHLPGSDLKNLMLTSKLHFHLIKPIFDEREPWSSKCDSFDECEARLDEIRRTPPSLRRYVQRLILKPIYTIGESPRKILGRERKLGQKLESVLPLLPNLRTFFWNGFEALDEAVWSTLRNSCPKIRYLGTAVGASGIREENKVFTFSNLLGFRLFYKFQKDLSRWTFVVEDDVHSLPNSMWKMLLDRCPQLRQFEIGGQGSPWGIQVLDVGPLVNGRWPELHKLTLGWRTRMKEIPPDAISNFFMNHHSLQRLQILAGSRLPIIDLRPLSRSSLKLFRGRSIAFALHIYPVARDLEELLLTEEYHYAQTVASLLPLLKNLHALRRLSIRVKLNLYRLGGGDDPESHEILPMVLFRLILYNCPRLEHISFLTSTDDRPSAYNFAMKDLHLALLDKPEKLKSIEVLKTDNGDEESMFKTTANVLRRCPGLDTIKLCYTKGPSSSEIIRQGAFTVERDSDKGHPKSLKATEIEQVLNTRYRSIQQRHYPIPIFEEANPGGSGSLAKFAKNRALTFASLLNRKSRVKVKLVRNSRKGHDDYDYF